MVGQAQPAQPAKVDAAATGRGDRGRNIGGSVRFVAEYCHLAAPCHLRGPVTQALHRLVALGAVLQKVAAPHGHRHLGRRHRGCKRAEFGPRPQLRIGLRHEAVPLRVGFGTTQFGTQPLIEAGFEQDHRRIALRHQVGERHAARRVLRLQLPLPLRAGLHDVPAVARHPFAEAGGSGAHHVRRGKRQFGRGLEQGIEADCLQRADVGARVVGFHRRPGVQAAPARLPGQHHRRRDGPQPVPQPCLGRDDQHPLHKTPTPVVQPHP